MKRALAGAGLGAVLAGIAVPAAVSTATPGTGAPEPASAPPVRARIAAQVAAPRPRAGAEPIALTPGTAVSGRLDPRRAERAEFVLDLPADAITARFDATSRNADVVVSLRRGQRVGDDGEADATTAGVDGSAPARLDRWTDPPIRPGRWYVRVECADEHAPLGTDGRPQPVEFALVPRVWRAAAQGTLVPDRRTEVAIPARDAGCRTLRIDVPEGVRALRVDVADTDADLDLYASFGAPALAIGGDTRAAAHAWGRETLVIAGADGAGPRAGPWFVDVVAPWDDERGVRCELLATFSPEPPAELLALPALAVALPRTVPELARALAAVVEITTEDGSGSGTVVGAAGWILTNAHVVEAAPGTHVDEVVVGCTLVPERPAVELFRGRVVRFDHERDLALVRVATGFYGQPVPASYRFPAAAIAASSDLLVGSPLWLVGYPATGGEGSRVTIHATRGVVSGFERGPLGDLLKTDAQITQGNSGGAALDAAGRLVGVPASTVESGSGHSGFVLPVELVPAEWRELVAH